VLIEAVLKIEILYFKSELLMKKELFNQLIKHTIKSKNGFNKISLILKIQIPYLKQLMGQMMQSPYKLLWK